MSVSPERRSWSARIVRAAGQAMLDLAVPRRCARCWSAVADGRDCRACRSSPPRMLDGIRAGFVHAEGARRLVHGLKYEGLSAVAVPMGRLLAVTLAEWDIRPDIVTSVPLH